MALILRGKRTGLPNRPSASALFLQLPPSYRSFHASPRPQFVEQVIPIAYSIIDGIHSTTGLSWAYTLPLSAFLIRATFVLPVSIYSRLNIKKQAALAPLINTWQHPLRKQVMQEIAASGKVAHPARAHVTLLRKTKEKRDELYRRWDCPRWKTWLPILQLPVWLTAIEAIREMCGQKSGLLGMVFRTKVDGIAQVLPVEESFATEGMLWFPDLMLSDPNLILPFILSGTIYLNISRGSGKNIVLPWQRGLDRALKLVALAIGPLTLNIPSGMLLYWIASSSFAYAQATILEKAIPLKSASVIPLKSSEGGIDKEAFVHLAPIWQANRKPNGGPPKE